VFVPRDSGNVNDHGGHRSDRLRHLISVVKLNIISNLCEGAGERGRVVGTRVIKNVVLEARRLAHILGGCPPARIMPAITMLATAAVAMLLAGGCWGVGDIRFLGGGCVVGYFSYFPMMKFNEIIRMMRMTVIGNHPWYSPEKLTREP
jgi:hypothetical protein